jgi:hypothetical protein
MGKRTNYSYEKYQKENKKKKKKAEKLEKKRLKKLENPTDADPTAQPPATPDAETESNPS